MPESIRPRSSKTTADHAGLGVKYRQALKSFDPTLPNPSEVVDRQVRGIDRAATDEIDGVVDQVRHFDMATTGKLEADFAKRIQRIKLMTAARRAPLASPPPPASESFLSRSLSAQIRRLASLLGLNSAEVAESAGQVASTSQMLAEGASEQAAALEETSASVGGDGRP